MTELDAARGELFLARAAVLVEGLTEKLALPFVFSALGYDVDREAISIIECGGKPNIPLSRGSVERQGSRSSWSRQRSKGKRQTCDGRARAEQVDRRHRWWRHLVIVLDPDFEAVARLGGHRRKPERAWREFAERAATEMPDDLLRVARLAISLAGHDEAAAR